MDSFQWRVAAEYGWGDGTNLVEDGIVLMAAGKLEYREYRPAEVRDLFLKFAYPGATRARLLEFAGKYGHPTCPVRVAEHRIRPEVAAFQQQLNCIPNESERLALLPYHVVEMPTILLLDTAIEDMRQAIKMWIEVDESRGRRDYGPLTRLVNEHLVGRAGFRIVQDTARTVQLEPSPHHLLGFMWLQLAQAITESTGYKFNFCVGCHKWLDLSQESSGVDRKCREDRRYCGDACRARAYRQRKRSGKSKVRHARGGNR